MRPSSSSKSRPWAGHQRPNAARGPTNLQLRQSKSRSQSQSQKSLAGSLGRQAPEQVEEEELERSLPGAKLARVAGQTISTGSLAAALAQYQPPPPPGPLGQSGPASYQPGPASYQPGPASFQPAPAGLKPAASQAGRQLDQGRRSHSQAPLLIRRSPKLGLVKCLLLALMGLDLALTCLVYQLARDDQVALWRWRFRLSLLNLLLTAAWFALLIGALLFHLYRVLIASALLHLASFALLLVLSLVHFARRIDYNTVHLAKLLALLFAVVMLHVYLLVMASLTLYLARGVRRRQRQARQLGANLSPARRPNSKQLSAASN